MPRPSSLCTDAKRTAQTPNERNALGFLLAACWHLQLLCLYQTFQSLSRSVLFLPWCTLIALAGFARFSSPAAGPSQLVCLQPN